MKIYIIKFFVFLLSIGWVFPIGNGLGLIDEWVNTELLTLLMQEPRVFGPESAGVPLEVYWSGMANLKLGFQWLTLVVVMWLMWYLFFKSKMIKDDHG